MLNLEIRKSSLYFDDPHTTTTNMQLTHVADSCSDSKPRLHPRIAMRAEE
jgi:hypothetical protein